MWTFIMFDATKHHVRVRTSTNAVSEWNVMSLIYMYLTHPKHD